MSQTFRCVPLLRPSVASHSMRYLCCHLATSGALNASSRIFSHCLLDSSTSPVRSVPIHKIFLQPLRHFWCPHSFPPTYQSRHKRYRPLTRDILRHQEEHCSAGLLGPFPTLFHLLQELHDFFLLFLLSSPIKLVGGSPPPISSTLHFPMCILLILLIIVALPIVCA